MIHTSSDRLNISYHQVNITTILRFSKTHTHHYQTFWKDALNLWPSKDPPSRGVRIGVIVDCQRVAKTAEIQLRYCSTVASFTLKGTMVSLSSPWRATLLQ
jgi:hypothetical protein